MLLQGIRQFFTTVQNLRFPVREKGKGGTKDPLVCPTADMLYYVLLFIILLILTISKLFRIFTFTMQNSCFSFG